MDNELMKACALYCEICDRTMHGKQKGMSIKEIRKKYDLKKRDVVVFLQFLIEIADLESCVDFVEYDADGEIQEAELSDVDAAASNGEIYIRIMDHSAYMPKKRMDAEDLHIQNETLFQNLSQKDMADILKEISNVAEEDLANFIVNKGDRRKHVLERKIKHKLLSAILNRNAVQVTLYGENKKKKKIHPMGLRYINLLDVYHLVYYERDKDDIRKMELSEIAGADILDETFDTEFHIYDYIERKKTEKMVLDVYCEGNVIKKMDLILSEYNSVEKMEKDDHVEYKFMTEDAGMFENVIKSFGRSVIVREPIWLRDKILSSAQEILRFYQMGM